MATAKKTTKKRMTKKEKEFLARREAFSVAIREVLADYKFTMTAELAVTPQGIAPRIVFRPEE